MIIIYILFFFIFYGLNAQNKPLLCEDWERRSDTIKDLNEGIRLDFLTIEINDQKQMEKQKSLLV